MQTSTLLQTHVPQLRASWTDARIMPSSRTGTLMQAKRHDRCCRQANGVGLSVKRLLLHPCRLDWIPQPCTRPPDHYFLYFAQTSTSQLQCHSSQTGSLMQVKMHARCSQFGRKRTGAPMQLFFRSELIRPSTNTPSGAISHPYSAVLHDHSQQLSRDTNMEDSSCGGLFSLDSAS